MRDDTNHISLVTKIRAMEGKLLKDTDYNNMHNMSTIIEIYTYLNEKEEYNKVFDAHEEVVELHRNYIEHLLVHSLYENMIKIYKFGTVEEKRFMDIIVTRLEVDMLKKCVALIGTDRRDNKVISYASFFKKHSNIEFEDLQRSRDIDEFISLLGNTQYKNIFVKMKDEQVEKMADYETALDINYYLNIWNNLDKYEADTRNIVEYIIGTEIDLYNIKTIYRCKKFYNMTSDMIKKYIVSVSYKIKPKELDDLIYEVDAEGIRERVNNTFYGRCDLAFDIRNIDASFDRVKNELHLGFLKKNPNSLARVYLYFDKKNYEIHYVTRIIENIRYKY